MPGPVLDAGHAACLLVLCLATKSSSRFRLAIQLAGLNGTESSSKVTLSMETGHGKQHTNLFGLISDPAGSANIVSMNKVRVRVIHLEKETFLP